MLIFFEVVSENSWLRTCCPKTLYASILNIGADFELIVTLELAGFGDSEKMSESLSLTLKLGVLKELFEFYKSSKNFIVNCEKPDRKEFMTISGIELYGTKIRFSLEKSFTSSP